MTSDPSHRYFDSSINIISKSVITSLVILALFTANILTAASPASAADDEGALEAATAEEEAQAAKEAFEREEILWFARAIYSESKVPYEQRLVAWVIRNRVEAPQYPATYQRVVLQPRQFSGLNATDYHYHTNVSLTEQSGLPGWASALEIAREVYAADSSERPIAASVWHFYSPVSVRRTPAWALGEEPVHTVPDAATGSLRFAFYAGVR